MAERKPIVVMSWAMRQNKTAEAKQFASKLIQLVGEDYGVEKILFPSMGMITTVAGIIHNSVIKLGAQNIAPEAYGMFSGEYSIDSLIDESGEFVEIGHWERREIFKENDELLNKKVLLTLSKGLSVVICIGEKSRTEDYELLKSKLYRQLFNDLFEVDKSLTKKIVVAYTPLWAVGESRAANVPHIHKVARLIRSILKDIFGVESSEKIRIIYGGSVSPENAGLIVQSNEIDGVFVGRFGSDPQRYAEVVKVVEENYQKELDF